MSLFKKKISEEEKLFQEENRKKLEEFNVTKAWGVKKYQVATQFIYDESNKWFVVVDGPEETFKERNPYIVDFDQVESVSLEVEEFWTKGKGEFELPGSQFILQEDYDKVYWRYNFNLIINTTHPYAKEIKYQMNFKPTITQVPNRKLIFVRKGFEIGGMYDGSKIDELVEKLEQLFVDEAKAIHAEKIFDIVTLNRPETIMEKLREDGIDDYYLWKIDNMTAHVKRAARIAKLLGSN